MCSLRCFSVQRAVDGVGTAALWCVLPKSEVKWCSLLITVVSVKTSHWQSNSADFSHAAQNGTLQTGLRYIIKQ